MRDEGTEKSEPAAEVKFEEVRGDHPACTSAAKRNAEGWGIELDHSKGEAKLLLPAGG